jgi:hypothetical protein
LKSITDWLLTHTLMWHDFDAKKRLQVKKQISNWHGKKAIFFFPFWTGKSNIYKSLGSQFPEYTLIYFDYPNQVFSEDVKVSLNYINEILDTAQDTINDLRRHGYEEIILIGSSFGANIALKLATMTKIDKVILNMIDKNIAQSIYHSSAMTILKNKLLRHGITQNKTDKIYGFISTEYLIDKIKNNDIKILLFLSKHDIFCTLEEFSPVLRKLDRSKFHHEVYINRFLGHILSIYKNVYDNQRIVDFIKYS